MVQKKSLGDHIFDGFNGLLMFVLFVIMVYPFLYVINYSISSISETNGSLLLLPKGINFDVYATLFEDDDVIRAAMISVLRCVIGAPLMLFVTGMAAYALATPDLLGGKWIKVFFTLTMYLTAGTISTYIFMKEYGLMNSFWVYILPLLCSAYNVILMRTYIESIPRSMQEAVYLDGGNDMQAYWKVIFPICKPVNAAILLFNILNQWNAFMDTQLYCLMEDKLYTLQYVLYNTVTSQTSLEALQQGAVRVSGNALKMGITVITVVPVMCVYPFLQKHFVSGIMIGSVKS